MSRMNDQQYLYNQSKKLKAGDLKKVQMISDKKISQHENSEYSPKKLKDQVD